MVKRNIKSYGLLSVTIILSFSFILSFFIYSDSSTYNKYKKVFSIPKNIITVGQGPFYYKGNNIDSSSIDLIKQKILVNRLDKMDNVKYIKYSYIVDELNYYSDSKNKIKARIFFVPRNFFPMYMNNEGEGYSYIKSVNGKSSISSENDVIIDTTLFDMIPNNSNKTKTINLPINNTKGEKQIKTFNVAGVVSNNENNVVSQNNDIKERYVDVYISDKLSNNFKYDDLNNIIYIDAQDKVNNVFNLCKDLNIFTISSFDEQNKAKEEIRNAVYTKSIVVIILIFLLGVNLYSSFNNVLKERAYEIGVKRAIGASKKNIIIQFFLEGIIVIAVNIVISVFASLNLAVIYKFYQKYKLNNQWTIYISSYSILIFLISMIFLGILFSIMFAYRSTKIEIITNLKSE